MERERREREKKGRWKEKDGFWLTLGNMKYAKPFLGKKILFLPEGERISYFLPKYYISEKYA